MNRRHVYYVQVSSGYSCSGFQESKFTFDYKISPGITANAFILLKSLRKFDVGIEVCNKPLENIMNINRDNYQI